jgi:YgiT-type zinc finger domain-containing protein
MMNSDKDLCPLCGGNKESGTTTFTVDLDFGLVVVRNVPATVCALCGAEWLDDDTAGILEEIVDEAREKHCAVEILDWPHEKKLRAIGA